MAEVNSCNYTIIQKNDIEPNKFVAEIYFESSIRISILILKLELLEM